MRRMIGSLARRTLPDRWLMAYRDYRAALMPTEEVFTRIYSQNAWGGRPGEFHSGAGSSHLGMTAPYLSHMRCQLAALNSPQLRLVDLGCGDFRIGEQLAPACASYVGVDIVRPLIQSNQARYGNARVSFVHANILEDELPPGDVCLVRQVLQHLSNTQIQAVLPKLNQYRWCFVTEHHPGAGFNAVPNLDKVHGRDVRVTRGSGVYLDRPPFNIPRDRYRWLFEFPGTVDLGNGDCGILRTYLLRGAEA